MRKKLLQAKLFKPLKNCSGESLIEVVVSCALFGILIVVATTIIMSAMDTTIKADRIQKGDSLVTHYYDGGETDPAKGVVVDPLPQPVSGDTTIIDFSGLASIKGDKKYVSYKPDKGYALRKFIAVPAP